MPLSHAKQVNHGDLEAPGLTHLTEDEGGQAAEVLSSQELREEVAGEVEFWRTGVGACHDTPDEEVCIEPENGKALAEQVLKLYRDPARCRALGTSGRHSPGAGKKADRCDAARREQRVSWKGCWRTEARGRIEAREPRQIFLRFQLPAVHLQPYASGLSSCRGNSSWGQA
jgi:hypothetical protein